MSARVKLLAFVVVTLTAGVLPWATGGSAAAKGLAVPFLLLAVGGVVAAVRLARPAPATPPPAQFQCCVGCAAASPGCASSCSVSQQQAS